MDEAFLGQMMIFGGGFPIRGWAFCDGQLLPISSNSALFSLLGTTYGGDGRTTFGLPDLRGRVAIHPGRGPGLSDYDQGERGGQELVYLTQSQIPAHTHDAGLKASNSVATISTPVGGASIAAPAVSDGRTATPALGFDGVTPNTALNPLSTTIFNNGGSQYHNNDQPFLGVYHLIALQGIYPSRS